MTWWFNVLELRWEFCEILYRASSVFPVEESGNYPYLAEALWAEGQGL
jgi:hypothetical protein